MVIFKGSPLVLIVAAGGKSHLIMQKKKKKCKIHPLICVIYLTYFESVKKQCIVNIVKSCTRDTNIFTTLHYEYIF